MPKLLLILLLLVPATFQAQTFNTSLSVPALTDGPLIGTDGVLRFDRRIKATITGGSGGEMFLYINTRTGDIGIRIGKTGSLGSGELDVNNDRFQMLRITPRGSIFNYQTNRKNGRLEHYVVSGNTELIPATFDQPVGTELSRQGGEPSYFTRTLGAAAYSGGSAAPTLYLYGGDLRREVTWQKFLGYAGIGYLKTNRGVHMSVRSDMGRQSYLATQWMNVGISMNLEIFKHMDMEMLAKMEERNYERMESLGRETFTGTCQGEQRELNRLKTADVQRRRELANSSTAGNVYQDRVTQEALAELQLPNLEVMNAEIELNACKLRMRAPSSDSREMTRRSERLSCYREQQMELIRLRMEWDVIDANNRNSPGRALMEKRQAMSRVLRTVRCS